MQHKPGISTSEFWLTLFATLVGLAVAAGVVPAAQGATIVHEVTVIVGGVIAIVPALGYVWSRASVKKAAIAGAAGVTP